MARSIDYGNLMHRAMRGLIQSVLTEVAEHGLPGAHHDLGNVDAVQIADGNATDTARPYPTQQRR